MRFKAHQSGAIPYWTYNEGNKRLPDMSDLAVEDVLLGVVVGAVQHLVAHAALEAPNVPLLTSS